MNSHHSDANPDSSPFLYIVILTCHLQIYADPDLAYHFDADPDPDPAYHVDADTDPDPTFQFYFMRIRVYNAVLL
jgi:hypothetical protein